MNAIVLEVKDDYAAVLCTDGTVRKLRGTFTVGQTVEVKAAAPAWRKSLRAAVAAVALVGILSAGGYSYQNVMAYSYVSLDIGGTSLEYTLNRRDQVIAVSGLNDASGPVADALGRDLQRMPLQDALQETVEYLGSDGDGYALVSVTSGSDDRAAQLAGAVDQAAKPGSGVEFHAETATPEERRAAEAEGMSPGRYQIKQYAQEPDAKDFRNGDIDDLMDRRGGSPVPAADREDTAERQPHGGGSQGQQMPQTGQPQTGQPQTGQAQTGQNKTGQNQTGQAQSVPAQGRNTPPQGQDAPPQSQTAPAQSAPAQSQDGPGPQQSGGPAAQSEPAQSEPAQSDRPETPELPEQTGEEIQPEQPETPGGPEAQAGIPDVQARQSEDDPAARPQEGPDGPGEGQAPSDRSDGQPAGEGGQTPGRMNGAGETSPAPHAPPENQP